MDLCRIRSIAFHPKAWNNGNFIGRSSDLFLLWRLPDPFHVDDDSETDVVGKVRN